MIMNTLFLHYGPGGNSSLEKLWFRDNLISAHLWDYEFEKIAAPSTLNNYQYLLNLVDLKIKESNPSLIISHSFGCDLALDGIKSIHQNIEKICLFSPVRNIPQAFINFSEHLLNYFNNSIALKNEFQNHILNQIDSEYFKNLQQKKETFSSLYEKKNKYESFDKFEFESFLNLAISLFSNPDVFQLYWAKKSSLNKFNQIKNSVVPLNLTAWSKTLEDKFSIEIETQNDIKNVPKKLVFLGENDLYYKNLQDEISFWQAKGFQVNLIKDCGHYTHLESQMGLKHLK